MQARSVNLKILIVILTSLLFAFLTMEDGVIQRKTNLFEILDIDPFSPSEIISNKIQIYNKDHGVDNKEFYLLMQKKFHDEYYKFGSLTVNFSEKDLNIRRLFCIAPYIFYLFIARIFLEDEMKMSKRICSIFTILGGLYEVRLFYALNQKDIIIEAFPSRMALFEIIKYIHIDFALFFLITIGIDSIKSNVIMQGIRLKEITS